MIQHNRQTGRTFNQPDSVYAGPIQMYTQGSSHMCNNNNSNDICISQ